MRALVAATCLLLLCACGSDGDTAVDPGTADPPMPTTIPGADGPVAGLGLVLDDGRPGLCLGPVAESYPPQCTGLAMTGWHWSEHAGEFEEAGGVRFGSFLVTGTFDGETLTYRSAISGAVYDPAPEPEPISGASEEHTQAELETIAQDLNALPGALSTIPGDNLVLVDVVHDDGSLQEWADARYGAGLVFVRSALEPTG